MINIPRLTKSEHRYGPQATGEKLQHNDMDRNDVHNENCEPNTRAYTNTHTQRERKKGSNGVNSSNKSTHQNVPVECFSYE